MLTTISEHSKLCCEESKKKKKKRRKDKYKGNDENEEKDKILDNVKDEKEKRKKFKELKPMNKEATTTMASNFTPTTSERRKTICLSVDSSHFRRQSSTTPSPDSFHLGSREGSPLGAIYEGMPGASGSR